MEKKHIFRRLLTMVASCTIVMCINTSASAHEKINITYQTMGEEEVEMNLPWEFEDDLHAARADLTDNPFFTGSEDVTEATVSYYISDFGEGQWYMGHHLDQINEVRERNYLEPLALDFELNKFAKLKAIDMAENQYFDIYRPGTGNLGQQYTYFLDKTENKHPANFTMLIVMFEGTSNDPEVIEDDFYEYLTNGKGENNTILEPMYRSFGVAYYHDEFNDLYFGVHIFHTDPVEEGEEVLIGEIELADAVDGNDIDVLTETFQQEFLAGPEEYAYNSLPPRSTQEDVEEMYGTHSALITSNGTELAVYGNLAIEYSGGSAYFEGNELIDVESGAENKVEEVYIFANVTVNEFTEQYGEPTRNYNQFIPYSWETPNFIYDNSSESRYAVYGEVISEYKGPDGEVVTVDTPIVSVLYKEEVKMGDAVDGNEIDVLSGTFEDEFFGNSDSYIYDIVLEGATQEYVEDMYGTHEKLFDSNGRELAVYGNLAIEYSGGSAYFEGNERVNVESAKDNQVRNVYIFVNETLNDYKEHFYLPLRDYDVSWPNEGETPYFWYVIASSYGVYGEVISAYKDAEGEVVILDEPIVSVFYKTHVFYKPEPVY